MLSDPKHDIQNCLCLNLRRSARQVTQFYDEWLRPSGLRVTQFTLLATVKGMQPTAHQPLADTMGMDRTTLTRNLALLERGGYLRVREAKKDHRENEVRLTAAGLKALEEAMPLWRSAQDEMIRRMSGDEGMLAILELVGSVNRVGSLTLG